MPFQHDTPAPTARSQVHAARHDATGAASNSSARSHATDREHTKPSMPLPLGRGDALHAEITELMGRFQPAVPNRRLDSLVLRDEERAKAVETMAVIQSRSMLEEMGLHKNFPGEILPSDVLIYGPPGTGKSSLATAIATELGALVLRGDPSSLRDQYVGRAAKLWRAFFARANELHASGRCVVLVFDDLEDLTSRLDGKTGAESDHNLATKVLLDNLEIYAGGPVIFTSNKPSTFDDAVCSRLLARIHLGLPDAIGRAKLWRQFIPTKVPVDFTWDDSTMNRLVKASAGLAGRDINMAVLRAATNAIVRSRTIGQPPVVGLEYLVAAAEAVHAERTHHRPKVSVETVTPSELPFEVRAALGQSKFESSVKSVGNLE